MIPPALPPAGPPGPTGGPHDAPPGGPPGAPARRTARPVVGGVLGVVGVVVLWLAAGAPWWAPVVLVAGGLAGRLAATVLPARARVRATTAGAGAAALWLAAQLSPAGQALAAGLAILVALLTTTPAVSAGAQQEPTDRGVRPPWTRWPWWRVVAAALAVVLLAAGGVGAGVERLRDSRIQARADQQAGDYTRAQLLPSSPGRAVRSLYLAVARDDPGTCRAFTPGAAAQLAAVTGVPDCPAAVRLLHSRISDPRRYERPDRDSIPEQVAPDGQTGTATGCRADWTDLFGPAPAAGTPATPGPVLGAVHARRQLGQGYLITDYQPCP